MRRESRRNLDFDTTRPDLRTTRARAVGHLTGRHRPTGSRLAHARATVTAAARVLWGRWNSAPAVKVRDPVTSLTATDRLTRWNSWTDGQSPDEKQHAGDVHREFLRWRR